MDEVNEILQRNRLEDVTWLCSLSESELDFLISLKKLVIQRAKTIGHEELAEKFNLKILRAIGFILMENVKEKVKDNTSLESTVVDQLKLIESCNLLKSCVNDSMDDDEIMALLSTTKSRKRRR